MAKFSLFFLFLLFYSNIFSSVINNKSIICSTSKFIVKGGFIFTTDDEVERYNILLNPQTGQHYVNKSMHCYTLINNEYAISEKGRDEGCGKPSSYIDSITLEYMMPINNQMLYANCSLFDGDLLNEIKNHLNK